jgi:ADP-dependent phosphofructokinase/glucokinase
MNQMYQRRKGKTRACFFTVSSISKMMTLLIRKKKSSPVFQVDDEYEKPLPSIAQDLDSAIICGWLSIKHGNEMNWSKRYCAVIDSTLHVAVSIEVFITLFSRLIYS